MRLSFTATQKQRLIELDAARDTEGKLFATKEERDCDGKMREDAMGNGGVGGFGGLRSSVG